MEPNKITECRAPSKLHWLDMAKGWLILADNLAKKDVHDRIDQAA